MAIAMNTLGGKSNSGEGGESIEDLRSARMARIDAQPSSR